VSAKPNPLTNDELSNQEYFDMKFITAGEIRRRLKVSSPTVLRARRKGRLPGAIEIRGHVFLWDRNNIEPYLQRWECELRNQRRGISLA